MKTGFNFGGAFNFPRKYYGLKIKYEPPYRYPKNHPCFGCPYTFNTSVPSCMLPERKDGGCFWYDLKRKKRPQNPINEKEKVAQRIFDFIKVLEVVKRKKGYVKEAKK